MSRKQMVGIGLAVLLGVAAQAAQSDDTKIIGLLFYADWCGSCKVLDPKLEAVKPAFADQPISFTRVDMTDAASQEESARYAHELGLDDVYAENEGRTGFMLLIDAKSKTVLDRLVRDQSEEELRAAIQRALVSVGSEEDVE